MQVVEWEGVVGEEGSDACSAEAYQVRAYVEGLADVSGEGAHIGSSSAVDFEMKARPVVGGYLDVVDGDHA